MSKFKVGDMVRIIRTDSNPHKQYIGQCDVIEHDDGSSFMQYELKDIPDNWGEDELELATNKGGAPVPRRTFQILKDLPTLRKGALFQEECDDGTQPYKLITPEFNKYDQSREVRFTSRASVKDQPQWFVEVFAVTPQYMTREELDQWEAFKQTQAKPTRKRAKVAPAKKAKTA